MVVILACLSLILTAGGGAMALYGADLIRSESGLALTQSGITMLSAGLVLAGLTTAVVELRRMRRLMELEDPIVHPVAPAAPPPPPPARGSDTASVPPVPVPAPAAPPVPASLASLAVSRPAAKDDAPVPPLPPLPEKRQAPGSGIPAEAKASLVGIAAARAVRPGSDDGSPSTPADVSGEASSPADQAHASEQVAGEPPAEKPVEAETAAGPIDGEEPGSAEDAAPTVAGERKMLATYNSGGITYFMFSDGSIEADMTGGRRRFTSMDELRGYIDTGKGGVLVEPATAGATG